MELFGEGANIWDGTRRKYRISTSGGREIWNWWVPCGSWWYLGNGYVVGTLRDNSARSETEHEVRRMFGWVLRLDELLYTDGLGFGTWECICKKCAWKQREHMGGYYDTQEDINSGLEKREKTMQALWRWNWWDLMADTLLMNGGRCNYLRLENQEEKSSFCR